MVYCETITICVMKCYEDLFYGDFMGRIKLTGLCLCGNQIHCKLLSCGYLKFMMITKVPKLVSVENEQLY